MKGIIVLAGLLAASLLTACSHNSNPAAVDGYQTITADEAKEKMDTMDVMVVDVRTAEEYAGGHIKDALLIPNESIENEPPAELQDKDAVILVYCRTGRRSAMAAEKLNSLGYTAVFDFGGISGWPYEVVTEEDK